LNTQSSDRPVLGYTALGAMCFIWLTTGWYIIVNGGFYSTARYTRVVTYADGFASVLMAFVFFGLAATGVAIILKRLNLRKSFAVMTAIAILCPPVACLIAPVFG
jgi:hypothetical protein